MFGWNKMHMQTQLRWHLGGCFVIFFGIYFAIVLLLIYFFYVSEIVSTVSEDKNLESILRDRLQYSTQAVAAMFYLIDKLGIDVSTRLSGVYHTAYDQKEGTDNPFPIMADAPGY